MDKKRIGFVSTRLAGTDGVSLEARKWAAVLTRLGHESFWFAGVLDTEPDRSLLVPEAFFNTEENLALNNQIFGTQVRSRRITNTIAASAEYLKDRLYDFLERFDIDVLVPQNALAIPMHIPLGIALTEVIAETGIPTIAHHHDMWWERSRFLLNAVQDILQSAFPPDLPSVRHVVINSMMQRELAARRGLTSTMIYNAIDFDAPRTEFDEFNSDFRESFGFSADDILILQPTRVVSRKGIEQALYLVKQLDLPNVKLLVSHSAGDEGTGYQDWLLDTAAQQDIEIHLLANRLHDTRKFDDKGRKLYTLWDVYPHADLITYPSLYEGFGNAFLEAVYFRKPLLVNRYSVYIVDIEPKGFETVAIDGFLTREAVARVRALLLDKEAREAMTDRNFEIARRFFSFAMLEQRLTGLLQSFFGAANLALEVAAKDFDIG
ncbi:MAG: glycosyltransferase [Spirochaetes bacterium]|jgi:glycosyltransferase involved in cell wall biosynthesis|nr:glycosyltransferase [Spirochaetota bacterium]